MKRRIAVIAAVALCALAHGQTSSSNSTQAPATDQNTLESARRELKELPATERSREVLGKQSGLGSAGLPTLTLPGDAAGAAARPDPNKPPSATWLQDALKQTDAEAAHRRTNDPALTRERDGRGGYKPVEVPNPLGQYMERWISPHDLELLRSGQDAKKSNESPDSFVKPWEPTQTANTAPGFVPDSARAPFSDTPGTPIVPIMPPTPRNPYIEEPVSTAPLPGPNSMIAPAISDQTQTDRRRSQDPLPSMFAATPQGTRQSAPLKPAATPSAEPERPPTAPIIDDRKYFPQLRRF